MRSKYTAVYRSIVRCANCYAPRWQHDSELDNDGHEVFLHCDATGCEEFADPDFDEGLSAADNAYDSQEGR